MALSIPIDIGSNQNTGAVSSIVLTLSTGVSAGDTIVVFVASLGSSVNPTFPTISDTAGNSYTAGTRRNIGLGSMQMFYKINAAALSIGNTITVSGATDVANGLEITACKIPSPRVSLDHAIGGSFSAGTSTSLNTGALIGPSTVVVMADYIVSGSADAYTQDVLWTSLTSVLNATNLDALRPSYRIVSGTASVSHAATLGTSRGWASTGVGFLEFIAATGGGTMSMMGV